MVEPIMGGDVCCDFCKQLSDIIGDLMLLMADFPELRDELEEAYDILTDVHYKECVQDEDDEGE